ncbi:MAG TPA: prolyl oligopeptidase family serine peptidase, partial [Solirubrobacteraceae bacterium]|nr:prolyl oligopeptidase family serine peptidase [Solirubrobacteraceae bacterium]
APRSFQVSSDGQRAVFLRSGAGDDPETALWVLDVDTGRERLAVGPADLDRGRPAENLSVQERARRERVRETAGGIVAYATDRAARIAALTCSGRLFAADLLAGGARELDVPGPVFDPRPDPTGRRIAFVAGGVLYVVTLADGAVSRLAGEPEATVSWGTAEFVAAEEMGRDRGHWWAPDGEAILAARVDEAPVRALWISDVADPGAAPRAVRYPTAGSTNARVSVHLLGLDGGPSRPVLWDAESYPYLASADWDREGPMIVVQSRDQGRVAILAVDPDTGRTAPLSERSDAAWTDLIDGAPRRAGGRLIEVAGAGDAVALCVDGEPVTPPEVEVRAVLSADDREVLFTASTEPTETHVWRWNPKEGASPLTRTPGVHTAVAAGGVTVIGSRGLDHDGAVWRVGGHTITSHAERPVVTPQVRMLTVGARGLRVGVVLPRERASAGPLPVLMDPYGGPHFQRVMAARGAWLEAQWLADQGFALVVADGRGTPGRGRAWARAVRGDLAGPVLEDQISALTATAAIVPELDLDRVAIRGWSFGGYLAALAVLERPDVFHAAVAGAPVTDWRLYDTHYTERYLGVEPDGADRAAYDGSSLLDRAAALTRPLMLIHGLADDNVVAAHTLTLSQRLTESGRPHTVLPLTGITHMTPQEAVAENLLTLQVAFLRQALGIPPPPAGGHDEP